MAMKDKDEDDANYHARRCGDGAFVTRTRIELCGGLGRVTNDTDTDTTKQYMQRHDAQHDALVQSHKKECIALMKHQTPRCPVTDLLQLPDTHAMLVDGGLATPSSGKTHSNKARKWVKVKHAVRLRV